MKNLNRKIVYLIIALMFSAKFVHAQNADDILKNVQKKYNSYKSVCAEFKQTFYWELANETQVVEGTICVKDGKQFRIETKDQDIISDGKTIWTVNKLNSQIIIKDAKDNENDNPFLQSFINKYIENYSAEKNDTEDNTFHLTLKSQSQDEFYPIIHLWVQKNYNISQIKQIDINNNSTAFEILSLNDNVHLGTEKFRVQNTTGYELIDLR